MNDSREGRSDEAKMQRPSPGVCEWLRIGEYERAERVVEDLQQLGVQHLRTGFSWADYLRPGGLL